MNIVVQYLKVNDGLIHHHLLCLKAGKHNTDNFVISPEKAKELNLRNGGYYILKPDLSSKVIEISSTQALIANGKFDCIIQQHTPISSLVGSQSVINKHYKAMLNKMGLN